MDAMRTTTAVRVGSGCAAPTTVLLVYELHTKKQQVQRYVGEPDKTWLWNTLLMLRLLQPHLLGRQQQSSDRHISAINGVRDNPQAHVLPVPTLRHNSST